MTSCYVCFRSVLLRDIKQWLPKTLRACESSSLHAQSQSKRRPSYKKAFGFASVWNAWFLLCIYFQFVYWVLFSTNRWNFIPKVLSIHFLFPKGSVVTIYTLDWVSYTAVIPILLLLTCSHWCLFGFEIWARIFYNKFVQKAMFQWTERMYRSE